MALKITTQIGTDKGITSEAYVRISDYQVSKYGSANFRIEIFQSQGDVPHTGNMYPAPMTGSAMNQQIGQNLYVSLTKQEERTRTMNRMVPVQVEHQVAGPNDESGNPTTVTHTATEMQEQQVEETYTATVPDLSAVEAGTIFSFAYGHLKAKLQDLFGAEHVIDC
jgi:hypothetical protein